MWHKKWFQFSILLVLAFVWGSSFILMKIGLKSFDNGQAAAIRIFLASTVLLPLSILNIKYLKKKDIRSLLIAGFIGSFLPAFLFMKAQTRIDSAMAGILNSLTPVFTLIIGVIVYQTKTRIIPVMGVLIGLAGALGLISVGENISLHNINTYALFIVLATLFYGISVNEIKTRLTHLNGIQITSLYFLFLWPASLVYLLFTDFKPVWENPGWPLHLLALAGLGIIGTALALVIMNSLLRYVSAVYTSSVTYIIPVFAIMWGILDKEKLLPLHVLFMAVILFGVYLTNRNSKQ